MQKENYEKAKTKQFEKYRAISLYTLLATQIKYDVTGIAVSPEFWLQMKLNDYSVSKSEFKKANNLIVKELNLSLIHISEPTRRTPISYAVFCLKKKNTEKKKKKTQKNKTKTKKERRR